MLSADEIRFATALFAPVREPRVSIDALGRYRFGDREAHVYQNATDPTRWGLSINEWCYAASCQRWQGGLWCGAGWEFEAAELAAIAWCERGILPEVRA